MHSFLKHIEERFGLYEGTHVPLEQPMIEEAEPELNSPKRGGKKKTHKRRGSGTGASSESFQITDPISYLNIPRDQAKQNNLLEEITNTTDIQKGDVILFYRLVTSNIGVVKSKKGNKISVEGIKTMELSNMEGKVTNGGVQNINISSS